MDFSKLTTNNWIAIGGGLVAFISGFFPWFSFGDSIFDIDQSGFDAGIFAILGIFLALAAGIFIALKALDIKDIKADNLSAEQIAMVLAAVATLFILLRVLIAPDDGGTGLVSRSWGGFLALIAAGATTAGAFLSGKDLGVGIPSADDFTGGGDGGGGGDDSSTF